MAYCVAFEWPTKVAVLENKSVFWGPQANLGNMSGQWGDGPV
jgi:hypothetical protein